MGRGLGQDHNARILTLVSLDHIGSVKRRHDSTELGNRVVKQLGLLVRQRQGDGVSVEIKSRALLLGNQGRPQSERIQDTPAAPVYDGEDRQLAEGTVPWESVLSARLWHRFI